MALISGEKLYAGEEVCIEDGKVYAVRCTAVEPVRKRRCYLKRGHEGEHRTEYLKETDNRWGWEPLTFTALAVDDDEYLDT